jgi:hypothetical protein
MMDEDFVIEAKFVQNAFVVSVSVVDCDWACLQWLMEYQLVVKDIGRIMLQLKAS